MDITEPLKILGIERLECVQLQDLASKIDHAAPDKITRTQVLMVLLGWLHEQIKGDNVLQHNTLFPDFVKLLRTGGTRQVCRYSKEEIMSGFQVWQNLDAVKNPTNRRRYLMAESELQQLFDESTSGHITSKEPRKQKHSAAYIQPSAFQEPLGNIVNRKQTGANTCPLGQRHAPSNSKGDTGGIDDKDYQYNHPYTTTEKNTSGYLPLGDAYVPLDPVTDELTSVQEAALQKPAEEMPWTESSKGPVYGGHGDISFLAPPSANYICNRCNKRGTRVEN